MNTSPAHQAQRWVAVGCGLFTIASVLLYGVARGEPGSRGLSYIILHGVATIGMWVSWQGTQRSTLGSRELARQTLIIGMVLRVALIAVPAFTTHDVERYLWDGKVVLEGLDPYVTPPNSPSVQYLRADWPVAAEHSAYPTLYPPAALATFATAALAGPRAAWWLWKLIIAAASLALLLPTWRLAEHFGMWQHVPLVALSPLLTWEGAVGGHLDILAACCMAFATWAIATGHSGRGGVWLGAGALLKMAPVLAAWPLAIDGLWQRRSWRHTVSAGASCLTVALCGYGAAIACGMHPVGSIGVFFREWRFGSPVGLATDALGPHLGAWVRLFLAVGGMGAVAYMTPRRGLWWGIWATLALPMWVSPVVFPWYLTVWVPQLVVAPSWLALAWVSAAPLSYEVIDVFDRNGVWQPAAWPLVTLALCWAIGAWADGRRPLHRVVGG